VPIKIWHLCSAQIHGIEDAPEVDAKELASRGLLRLPVDLRSLRCRVCPDKFILVTLPSKICQTEYRAGRQDNGVEFDP
jgi:hypothetical protein